MGYEIERKFLVNGDYKSKSFKNFRIKQGYLALSGISVVRVRIKGEKAFVTIKSALEENTIKRNEWEYEIPVQDAEEMLLLCEEAVIEKTRYLVNVGNHVFEVDEFYGDNEGLLIAEVELESADQPFDKPDWAGMEVTDEPRYYNLALASHPYMQWSAGERA